MRLADKATIVTGSTTGIGEAMARRFVAEGAREVDGEFVSAGAQEANREARLGGIGVVVATRVEKETGKEARTCVLGHLQRGGSPTAFDRVLCSTFGAYAVELLDAGDFGKMVAWQGSQVTAIRISANATTPAVE